MKRGRRRVDASLVVLVGLAACGGSVSPPPPEPVATLVTGTVADDAATDAAPDAAPDGSPADRDGP